MSELQSMILSIVQSSNGWMTRAQIAKGLKRKNGKLSAYDIELLNDLVSTGKVKERENTIGIVQKRYEYIAK